MSKDRKSSGDAPKSKSATRDTFGTNASEMAAIEEAAILTETSRAIDGEDHAGPCVPAAFAEDEKIKPYLGGLPYNRDRLVNEIRFYLNQTTEGIIETGKRLIVLKIKEKHGNFISLCEDELGIPYRTAARFMAIARKFANVSRVTHLVFQDMKKGIGKLYALLEVPDEELQEFEETGEIRGLTIDEIDALPVKEVRDRLRHRNKQIEQGKLQLTAAEDKVKDLERQLADAKAPPVYTSDEQKYIDIIAELGMDFDRILLGIETRIAYNKGQVPEVALKKLYYLLVYIQRATLDERLSVSQHWEGALDPIPYEPHASELPSLQEMYDEVPHLHAVVSFMEKKAARAQQTPDDEEATKV
jgi:hypothetical protein